MVERIPQRAKDVLARINAIVDALNQTGNPLNPVYQSFGGAWSISDVRPSGAKVPQDYRGTSSVIEFNTAENFGGLTTHNNGYGYVMTVVGFDSAGAGGGGFPVQLAFADNLSVRRGTSATTWSTWRRMTSYDDQIARFGSSVKVGQTMIVGGDATTTGAAFLLQNGGASTFGLGNKSALLGGPYDGTPFIFSPVPVGTYSGFNFGGMISMKGQSELARFMDDGAYASFYNTAGTARQAYIQSVVGSGLVVMSETGVLKFGAGGSHHATIDASGNFFPSNDGAKYNGLAQFRWAAMYSVTGAIQTSDARKKTSVTALTPAMRTAAREMLQMIGTYQWLDSVKEKGADKARLHVGFTVQQAISILEKHGIDPFSMAFICHDKWDAEYENRRVNAGEKVTKLRIVQKQKTRTVKQPQDMVELINGKPVLVRKIVEVAELVFEEMPVQREDGSLVMLDEHTPMLHRVPVMETVQEPYEAEAEPKYEKVLVREAGDCFAFRYDQLTLFMLSALAA